MEIEQVLALFDKIDFFSEFTAEEKKVIGGLKSNIQKFQPNERIIKQGEADFSVFILLKGNVSITKNEHPDLTLNKLKAGDVFGEMSLLAKRLRSTNVIADSEVISLKLDGEHFDKIDPVIQNKFKDRFIEILIKRLDDMNEAIMKIVR
jgi:serine/threonine-protein kinase